MVFVILGIVAGIAVSFLIAREEDLGFEFEAVFIGMFFCFIGGIIGVAISGIVWIINPTPTYTTYKLINISDGKTSSGSFFLASGSFEDKPAFFYYVEDDLGQITLEKSLASKVVIFETTDTPRAVCKSDYIGLWSIDFPSGGSCKMYLPNGSILQNYQLPRGTK